MFSHEIRKVLRICLFILSLPLSFASAQYNDSLYTMKGNIDFNIATGWAKDIALDNNTMYVQTLGGIRVYDISDVSNPIFLGGVEILANDIEIKDHILYALSHISYQLHIIDFSNVVHPIHYNPYPIENPIDAEIEDYCIYIARGFEGVCILDISDPTSPVLKKEISTHNNGYFYDIDIEEDYLYVADNRYYTESLHIFDLDRYELISSYMYVEGSGNRIEVSGDFAYLYADLEGLQIIDISDRGGPEYRSNFNLNDCITDVEVFNGTVYLAYCRNGLIGLDVSDPWHPEMTDNVELSWVNDIEISGNTAFVADGDHGIKIIDVSNPSSLTVLEQIETHGSATQFDLWNHFAFIANERMGFCVVDISGHANPVLINSIEAEGSITDIEIRGDNAYVLDDEIGLLIYDISDPHEISLDGSLSLDGKPKELVVSGNRVYIADIWERGLWLVDISDPEVPQLLANFEDMYARNLIAEENMLYYAVMGDGFHIIDFIDVLQPQLLGEIDIPQLIEGGGVALDIEGTTAYVAFSDGFGNSAWLGFVDISDFSNPQILNEMNLIVGFGSINLNLNVADNVIYLAENDGVQIIDVSDKMNPVVLGKFRTTGIPYDLKIKDDNIYIAEGSSGFSVYEPIPPPVRGDVDGDGAIDIQDVIMVVNHILGLGILEGEAVARADCNADGGIDVLDVVGIVNVILELGTCGP